MKRHFDRIHCTGCGNCIRFCPKGILKLSSEPDEQGIYITVTDEDACISCRSCETMCTRGAFWFSDTDEMPEDIRIMGRESLPDHAGCQFGIMAHMLSRAIVNLGIEDTATIFRSDRSEANLLVDSRGYEAPYFFEEALKFKQEHPERLVVIFYSDPKAGPHENAKERFKNLKDEKITLIHCLGYFEQTDDYQGYRIPSEHLAEQMAQKEGASYIARGNLTTVPDTLKTERYMEEALRCQMRGEGFSVVEIIFPCFFRLEDRPKDPITPETRGRIHQWFSDSIVPEFRPGILKEK
ncbi:MAG: 4Fe-4S dicluster domain-containing protein [Erysipelotrichaceae bacterium]|nr:4Fe-4S dicluster domain-containing protein [Erysipelotrichaceae bacterium]MDO5121014.1 4Fe-4S dicluster domain-containing protein [Erysipelotrichaceae bacterium]